MANNGWKKGGGAGHRINMTEPCKKKSQGKQKKSEGVEKESVLFLGLVGINRTLPVEKDIKHRHHGGDEDFFSKTIIRKRREAKQKKTSCDIGN